MVRVPTDRAPSHPGEMLLREFLQPLGLTALRLSKVFETTPGFWMNHQLRWDLFHAQRDAGEALERIEPVPRDDLARTG